MSIEACLSVWIIHPRAPATRQVPLARRRGLPRGSHFFYRFWESSEDRTLCTLSRARCRFEVVSRKTCWVRELKQEAGAGGARSAQDRQQGTAAPVAARRAIVRAHLAEPYQWTAAVSFTVL